MVIASSKTEFNISVYFERRADGGMRVSSVDVPGFVLSHPDADLVFQDVVPALETIVSEMIGKQVRVTLPSNIRARKSENNVIEIPKSESGTLNYVAIAA